MKKIALLSSICAMGAVFAADIEGTNDCSNVIGALRNSSGNKPEKILVAVPFLGYGVDDSNVKVSDLIATANLPEGTILRVVHETEERGVIDWDCWILGSDKKWATYDTHLIIDGKDSPITSDPASDVKVGRGSSVWLEFPKKGGTVQWPDAGDFYTLGQVDFATSKSITLVPGKWNLVGNPGVESFDILAKLTPGGSGFAFNDQITVQSAPGSTLSTVSYTYNTFQKKFQRGVTPCTSIQLEPGQGCWIKLKNGGAVALR